MAQELPSILAEARAEDSAGNPSRAMLLYRRYLQKEPGDSGAWADYAGLLMVVGRFDDSVRACDQALQIDPECEPALMNKAAALMGLQEFAEAKEIYGRLRALSPDRADLALYYQKCNYKLGDTSTIELELSPILDRDPDNLEILFLLVASSMKSGDHQKYKQHLSKILDINSQDENLLHQKGTMLIRLGELKEGFKFYEYREISRPDVDFAEPAWNGGPFPGRTLLLHWEQGLGDTIMMLRFLPQVKALGGTVILQVQAPLLGLAKTCAGPDHVITAQDPLPNFDIHLRLMSLPHVLGIDIDSIPAQVPYLSVPPEIKNRDAIAQRLNQSKKPRKIGLVWAGGVKYKNDHIRSISPEYLVGFEQFQDASWYSLQRETPDLLPFQGLAPMADLMETFADTAFVLDSMDIVVTVDTSVAHLAGALGKPVLLMLPFVSEWRWMLGRLDSPWYPTMRLYRQPFEGAWGQVIDAAVEDLQSY